MTLTFSHSLVLILMNIFRGYTKYSLEDTQLISKILRQSQDKPYVATSSNLNDFSMYKIMRHFKELLPCQKNSVNVNQEGVCRSANTPSNTKRNVDITGKLKYFLLNFLICVVTYFSFLSYFCFRDCNISRALLQTPPYAPPWPFYL